MPLFAAYGASKAALSMFSGVMRQELSKWGIKVAVFHPSGFKTCKFSIHQASKHVSHELSIHFSPNSQEKDTSRGTRVHNPTSETERQSRFSPSKG